MIDQKNFRNLLAESQKTRTAVFVSGNQLDIAFQTVIRQIDGPLIILENMVRPEFITRFSQSSKFYLQCKMLRLQTTAVKPHGPYMAFEIQDNSVTEETRQSERFMFTPDERVEVEILNPFDKKTILKRAVMDMSATGLSLRTNALSAPFKAGVVLPHLNVTIDGKHWTTTAGEVVYNRKFMDLKGVLKVQVGLKFEQSTQVTRR